MRLTIVTNRAELISKYGRGYAAIERAIMSLAEQRSSQGCDANVAFLDDYGLRRAARSVISDTAARDALGAIEVVCSLHEPDALLIIGAPDIVPHAQLRNPMNDVLESTVFSDLPFALNHSSCELAVNSLEPVRAVGRIPDVSGIGDPGFLLRALEVAKNAKPRWRESYTRVFAICALPFAPSTRRMLSSIFGEIELFVCPPYGPEWADQLIERRFHILNCHGRMADPFLNGGQSNGGSRPSLFSRSITGRIADGTIVAVESCFGARLYEPLGVRDIPLANAYLSSGAYAFVGSTGTCYGGYEVPRHSDVLIAGFLAAVLTGAPLGAAMLTGLRAIARQSGPVYDETSLKTLAQFVLLGDPSIQPICVAQG